MALSVFTIESVARLGKYLISDCKGSGMIARKTGSLHVHVFGLRPVCAINFSRDQSSDKLINFLDSQLDTRDSRLNTPNYWGVSIEGLSTYFWAVLYVLFIVSVPCKKKSSPAFANLWLLLVSKIPNALFLPNPSISFAWNTCTVVIRPLVKMWSPLQNV